MFARHAEANMGTGDSIADGRDGLPSVRLETPLAWSDLVLPRESRDAIDRIRALARRATGAAIGETGSTGVEGLAVLFRGPSGTGKTLAQALLGKALGRPVFAVDLSAIVSKFIGETEKAIDRIFDAAEAAGAILAFDEADALFGKRSEIKDAHDRYANVEAAYLLQRLERFHGLAIFATSRPQDIDPGFLRRLRFVVDFPPSRRRKAPHPDPPSSPLP
jgi:vesicle-fusing ATPase